MATGIDSETLNFALVGGFAFFGNFSEIRKKTPETYAIFDTIFFFRLEKTSLSTLGTVA